MDKLPHEYLRHKDHLKEQIRITFFIENHLPYVKLSLRVDDMLWTCTEQIMSRDGIRESIESAEYKLFYGKRNGNGGRW